MTKQPNPGQKTKPGKEQVRLCSHLECETYGSQFDGKSWWCELHARRPTGKK